MAIPDQQCMKPPLPELAGADHVHRVRDLVDLLADRLRLTDADRSARSSDDQSPRFYHRTLPCARLREESRPRGESRSRAVWLQGARIATPGAVGVDHSVLEDGLKRGRVCLE